MRLTAFQWTLVVTFLSGQVHTAEKIPAIPEMFASESRELMVNDQHLHFEIVGSHTSSDGVVLIKYRQFYEGLPLWGEDIHTWRKDGEALPKVNGNVFANISQDLPSIDVTIEKEEALAIARSWMVSQPAGRRLSMRTRGLNGNSPQTLLLEARLWVYIDENARAKLVYSIHDSKGISPRSTPLLFVDALDGVVIDLSEGKNA